MAKVYRNFSVEELEEEYDLPYGDCIVSNEEGYKSRWYTYREIVFQADNGDYYLVGYMDPATEMQEGQDRWIEDTKGMVTAVKVKDVPTTVMKWEPVDVEV